MAQSGDAPRAIVEKKGWCRCPMPVKSAVAEVLDANPGQVAAYRGGKTKILGFLVGQVMKATRGKANPDGQ